VPLFCWPADASVVSSCVNYTQYSCYTCAHLMSLKLQTAKAVCVSERALMLFTRFLK
jgi:hypothetical protein